MLISQLAERSGVPATTLRFYESSGLLTAERTPAGYRRYGAEAMERLAFIGAAKRLGLALDEIAELLAVWESGACAEVKADLRPRVAARIAEAEGRAAELAAFVAALHRALAQLDALPDRSERCDPGCTFLATAPAAAPEPRAAVPVACSLTGAEAKDRARRWRDLLAGAEREPIEGGLRLLLPAGAAGDLATLAAAEQRCCPFFDFLLRLDGPKLRLEVTAPAEAEEQLAALFGPPPTFPAFPA
ncbi:MerR family transcriptional regulator [Streptomyces sp. NBRC 109706]|uniref:MerR family transcriptional regulator n=1 Tax=Streptomyces sp. NBRC 109706 TaxID=1550035 RepID=UPI00078266D0|nr:MerR family transcriptional regulator [Streptomyces sp. NBRC 109706]